METREMEFPVPVLEVCQKTLYIPMKGEAESLNAGVASSLILWEMCR